MNYFLTMTTIILAFPTFAEVERSAFRTFSELQNEGFEILPMNGPDLLILGMSNGRDTYSCWLADTPSRQQDRQNILMKFVDGDADTAREVPNIELLCVKLQ